MSEFSDRLRYADGQLRYETAPVPYQDLKDHEGITADLLDALDARVRALEGMSHTHTMEARTSMTLYEADADKRKAVLAERERCASIADSAAGRFGGNPEYVAQKIAAEIRRGA